MAHDLRGVILQESCKDISAIELRNDSTPVDISDTSSEIQLFRFEQNSVTGSAIYFCGGGKVISQALQYEFESKDEASEFFTENLESLRQKLGKTCNDYRQVPLWRRLYLTYIKDVDPEFFDSVNWDLGDNIEAVQYMRTPTTVEGRWAVIVTLGSRPSVESMVSDYLGLPPKAPVPMKCIYGG